MEVSRANFAEVLPEIVEAIEGSFCGLCFVLCAFLTLLKKTIS